MSCSRSLLFVEGQGIFNLLIEALRFCNRGGVYWVPAKLRETAICIHGTRMRSDGDTNIMRFGKDNFSSANHLPPSACLI